MSDNQGDDRSTQPQPVLAGSRRHLRLRLPGALVKFWSPDRGWLASLEQNVQGEHGFHAIRAGLVAVVPVPGDAAVIEAAHAYCQATLADDSTPAGTSALILPGEVEIAGFDADELRSPLLEDLETQPPRLEPGVTHLTAHATWELESGWRLESATSYRGPSGRELPIWRLAGPIPREAYRNPTLLGSARHWVDREALREQLDETLRHPLVLVEGPLGCGKSRLVADRLGKQGHWARPWSERARGPSIARQLLRSLLPSGETLASSGDSAAGLAEQLIALLGKTSAQLGVDGEVLEPPRDPLLLVIDDAQNLEGSDFELVGRLSGLPSLGTGFRLLLIGRSGGAALAAWQTSHTVRVPRFESEEMLALSTELLSQLSMPTEVQERLLSTCDGFPFTFEECLLQMARRKVVRRVYGNFFYAGATDSTIEASPRFLRHLVTEFGRLGNPTPLYLLSHIEQDIPVEELTELATGVATDLARDWYEPYTSADLVQVVESNLFEVLRFTCEQHRHAAASRIPASATESVRHLIGRSLAALAPDGDDSWQAYSMLAGTPDAIPVLLKLARNPPAGASREQIFDALLDELDAHRERGGGESEETGLLWALLPLARRMGQLHQLGTAIDRAIELSHGHESRLVALTTLKADYELADGRARDAERTVLAGLEMAHGGDDNRKAVLFVQLGKILQRQDRHPEARRLFEEVVPLLDESGNDNAAATCRFHLGNIALHENRFEVALDYHREALEIRRNLDNWPQMGSSLSALGSIYLAMGDYPQALDFCRQAETVLEKHGREGEISFALIGVGRALTRLGEYTAASSPFRKALTQREGRDDRAGEAIARLIVAENHLHLGQADAALEEARKAHFELSLAEASKTLGDAEQVLGRTFLQQRNYEQAHQHLENAIALHQQHGDILAATFDRAWLLEVSLAVSDHRRIEELCSAIEAVLETLQYPESGEMLDLRLYQGLEWLRQRGRDVKPEVPLERAFKELYRKTELLSADLRNAFLYQVPDNRAIFDAATRHGVTPPTSQARD